MILKLAAALTAITLAWIITTHAALALILTAAKHLEP